MKVLVKRETGISFRDNVTKVTVDLGFCSRIERLINGEGVEMTDFQEYSLEEILDYYESSVPITLSDPENQFYFEVKYLIEDDFPLIEGYISNRLDFLLEDIFNAMKKEFLVIDDSKAIKHKLYSGSGEAISED